MDVSRRVVLTGMAGWCLWPACADACPTRKLIEVGWHTPEVQELRSRIAEVEERAPFFDGLVLDLITNAGLAAGVTHTNVKLGWLAYGQTPVNLADYSEAIAHAQATPFKRYDHNLLRLATRAGGHDLFSPLWDRVTIPNVTLVAQLAKDLGCKGIWFDTEQYAKPGPFTYTSQIKAYPPTRPAYRRFVDYQTRARALGLKVVQAMQEGFPGLDILLTFGYPIAHANVSAASPLDKLDYSLLPAFLDGMLDGRVGFIYDGTEQAYGFGSERMFQSTWNNWKIDDWSKSPQRHKYMISYGLWVDYGNPRLPWSTSDLAGNYFHPAVWGNAVGWGLQHTQHYVWVYSERANWFDGSMPQAYQEAMRAARARH